MTKYRVTETVEYIVDAENEDDAIEAVIHGEETAFFHAVTDRQAELEHYYTDEGDA